MAKINLLMGLKELPIELRNQVYYKISKPKNFIEPPDGFEGDILNYFRGLIPGCLGNDPEIANEATMELFHQTVQIAQSIKVPGPEFFDAIKPSDIQWKSVRFLEFTGIQHTYGSSTTGSPGHLTIHDVVTGCPNLRKLKIRVSPAFIQRQKKPSPTENHPQDFVNGTHKLLIMEHVNIRELELGCALETQVYRGEGYTPPPEPPRAQFVGFVKAFKKEADLKERMIKLTVNFSPDESMNPHGVTGYSDVRKYADEFTWTTVHDFW